MFPKMGVRALLAPPFSDYSSLSVSYITAIAPCSPGIFLSMTMAQKSMAEPIAGG
jgi:hypothetical protein